MQQISERDFKVIELQCLYMMRPHCKVRKCLTGALIENIQDLNLPETLEVDLLAKVIVAERGKPDTRRELLNRVLDLIEAWIEVLDE